MLALIGGLRGILSAIGGAGIAFCLFWTWNAALDNPRVHKAGRAEERAIWQEAQRKLIEQMDAQRRSAQAAIDEIERQFLIEKERDRRHLESLEQELKSLENADEADTTGPRRPFIPDSLVRKLDKVGR